MHTMKLLFVFQRNLTFVESAKISDKPSNNSIYNSNTAQIVFIDSIHSKGRASQTLPRIQKL